MSKLLVPFGVLAGLGYALALVLAVRALRHPILFGLLVLDVVLIYATL